MELITKLQKLREEKRLSRPQLAEQVGVSWETIKAYEVKGAYPSIHVAFKLAKALECKVDDLFNVVEQSVEEIFTEVEKEVDAELTEEERAEHDNYMKEIAEGLQD